MVETSEAMNSNPSFLSCSYQVFRDSNNQGTKMERQVTTILKEINHEEYREQLYDNKIENFIKWTDFFRRLMGEEMQI